MIEWIKILIELICIVAFVIIIMTVYNYRDYKKITSECATIDFKCFEKLYNATPEKWLFDHHRSFLCMLYVDGRIDSEYVFMNTYYEYHKLKNFYKNYKKAEKQKSKELSMEALEKCWHDDTKD